MKNSIRFSVFSTFVLAAALAYGTKPEKLVLLDSETAKTLKLPVLETTQDGKISLSILDETTEREVLEHNHLRGRCGGFQLLAEAPHVDRTVAKSYLKTLSAIESLHSVPVELRILNGDQVEPTVEIKTSILSAMNSLDAIEVKRTIQWISSFPTRFHRETDPNVFVRAFKNKLLKLVKTSTLNATVTEISHVKTKQNSLRVRIEGSKRPQEIVVLGGHMDSILGWGQIGGHAPGADDNASGSANILEVLRQILIANWQPERSLEFFWYAGEEGGLIGSTEIAKSYSSQKKDVVAVMQLDMTLFPGSGKFVMTSIEDYTHPGLRVYLEELNKKYTQYTILKGDKCGYACSDHASWHSQGFASVYPFESHSDKMNFDLHTEEDVLSEKTDPEHSAAFAKLALVFMMDLSQSTFRPY